MLHVLERPLRASDASRDVSDGGWTPRPMSGPSKKSSLSSDKAENVLVYVERLRQQVEEFQRTVEEELRTARALLEELHVREAKMRGRGKRMD